MNENQFISSWIQKLVSNKIKKFPDDFYVEGDKEEFSLPSTSLLIGQEFFGEYELIDITGKEILKTNSYEKAKYFFYANRLKPNHISIPKDSNLVFKMVSEYEMYLDTIIKNIEIDYRQNFPSSKSFLEVLNKIFSHLNIVRL